MNYAAEANVRFRATIDNAKDTGLHSPDPCYGEWAEVIAHHRKVAQAYAKYVKASFDDADERSHVSLGTIDVGEAILTSIEREFISLLEAAQEATAAKYQVAAE